MEKFSSVSDVAHGPIYRWKIQNWQLWYKYICMWFHFLYSFFQALNKLREEVKKSFNPENKLTASSAKVRPLSQMRI